MTFKPPTPSHARQSHRISSLFMATLIAWLGVTSVAAADSVEYSITLNTTLHNGSGTWGGNLNLGANQAVNATILYVFDAAPQFVGGTDVRFDLETLQVLDNTSGLASDVITAGGSFTFRYLSLDIYQGATSGYPGPGGTPGFSRITADIGDFGDPAPHGAAFDAIVNAEGLSGTSARAFDLGADYLGGTFGVRPLSPGNFTFTSRFIPIPEPSTALLLALGIGGLARYERREG